VFAATPAQLARLTGARIEDLAQGVLPEQRTRALLLAHAAVLAESEDAQAPSPCISVCRMNADTGFCEGCLRTISEITAWSRSSPAAKREVWAAIAQRAAA
jgi:predicted Fe-S protein YdhL (DUF1289 family)